MRVGWSKQEITPPLGIELCGYGYYLERRAEAVLDPLFVRSLALQNPSRTLVLVSADIIGFSADMTARIKHRLALTRGLAPHDILLTATHTHSGPATNLVVGCGEPDSQYLKVLEESTIAAVLASLDDLGPAKSAGATARRCPGLAFNRTQAATPVDDALRCLVFHRSEGRPLLAVNFACHPVVLEKSTYISADYPGRMCAELEQAGVDALFLPGFFGDVNPVSRRDRTGSGTEADLDKMGRALSDAVVKSMNQAVPIDDTLSVTAFSIKLPLQELETRGLHQELDALRNADSPPGYRRIVERWTGCVLQQVEQAVAPKEESIDVRCLNIGGSVVVAVPGEVFSDIGWALRKQLESFCPKKLLLIGGAEAMVGYLPSAVDVQNRGYASYEACRVYDRWPFSPRMEAALVSGLSERIALELQGGGCA